MSELPIQKFERLKSIAERAFRSKHNPGEAAQALKIFDSLCNKWGVTTEQRNSIWHDLEQRYPELDRRKALTRMSRLLSKYLHRRAAIAQELTKWKVWEDEKLDIGAVKLVEHVDLCAVKYLLSLRKHDFKTLYFDRAKKKSQEGTQRKKDGSKREVKESDIDKLVESSYRDIREMCIEYVKGKGSVQRKYTFKAPKTFGRRFTRGMQGIWSAFKCILVKGRCTDFDAVNAHPTILLWVCTSLGIECGKLHHYVENRDKVLVDMMYSTGTPRKDCKEQFLVATNEGKPMRHSPFPFFNEFDLEMKSIHAAIVCHPTHQWIREYVHDKEDNYNGSFVNIILCYWENILAEYAIAYFRGCMVDVNVLMFDGLMVSKKEDDIFSLRYGQQTELDQRDCEWHCSMLNEICKHVFGIDMKWDTKPLTDKRLALPDDFDPGSLGLLFEEIIPDFNEKNVKIGENYVTINRDGSFSLRTKEKFRDYHNHIGCMNSKTGDRERFIYKWVDDYDEIPFKEQAREYPPGGPADRSCCPEDHFNVWEKFAFDMWDTHENPDGTPFKYNARAVELFKNMVMGLLGDDEQHFQFWMEWNYANLMHPATKSGRCPFIISKQGVGKDTLVSILQKIFGYARCVTESDPAENIWGKFNEVLQGTYLIILTEVGFSDFMLGIGRVKHLISQYEYTLNLKGGAKIKKMSSFHRFMGITNVGSQGEISPVPVTEDERRFLLFYSSVRLKGDTAFWNEMYSLIDDWSAIRSILQFMLTFEHGPMFADAEVPVTEFQKSAVTTHPILQFIQEYVNETQFCGKKCVSCDLLWNEYRAWCGGSNVQLNRMTKEHFGIKLSRFDIPGISKAKPIKEHGKVERKRTLDYEAIRAHFPDDIGCEKGEGGDVRGEGFEEKGDSRDEAGGGGCGRGSGRDGIEDGGPGRCSEDNCGGVESGCGDEPLGGSRVGGVRELGGEGQPGKDYVEEAIPVDVEMREEQVSNPCTLKIGGLTLVKRKREPTNIFDEMRREERDLDLQFKNTRIKRFRSAGVILYNTRGYWLGYERGKGICTWTDYGGKRKGDETPWETAVRECREEAGIDISKCRLKRSPDFHSDSNSKHVLFWVETDLQPIPNCHPCLLNQSQFKRWPECELHPRLLYDKGCVIKKTREALGFFET